MFADPSVPQISQGYIRIKPSNGKSSNRNEKDTKTGFWGVLKTEKEDVNPLLQLF